MFINTCWIELVPIPPLSRRGQNVQERTGRAQAPLSAAGALSLQVQSPCTQAAGLVFNTKGRSIPPSPRPLKAVLMLLGVTRGFVPSGGEVPELPQEGGEVRGFPAPP